MIDPDKAFLETDQGRRWKLIMMVVNLVFILAVLCMGIYGYVAYRHWEGLQYCECPEEVPNEHYIFFDDFTEMLYVSKKGPCRCIRLEGYDSGGLRFKDLTLVYAFVAPFLVGGWLITTISYHNRREAYFDKVLNAEEAVEKLTGGSP